MYGTGVILSLLVVTLQKYPWLILVPVENRAKSVLWRACVDIVLKRIPSLTYTTVYGLVAMVRRKYPVPLKAKEKSSVEGSQNSAVPGQKTETPLKSTEYLLFTVCDDPELDDCVIIAN